MTVQRQEKNRPIRTISLVGGLAGLWLAFVPAVGWAGATTQRVVIDRFSGLAIDGFDPVAYFVEGRPVRGVADFEAIQGGAVWRFHNQGDRASFVAHPEVYGPQFGGYDPTELTRGVTLAGNPLFWVIAGERLYLFGFEANRDAFAADPKAFLSQAKTRWPQLERGLAQ